MFKPSYVLVAIIVFLIFAYNFVGGAMQEQANATYSQSAGSFELGGDRTVQDTLNNGKAFNY